MADPSLVGKVAVVTGASRGIGKGCALELGAAGATVYVTGRTLEEGSAPLPGTIGATADEVTAAGGLRTLEHLIFRLGQQLRPRAGQKRL